MKAENKMKDNSAILRLLMWVTGDTTILKMSVLPLAGEFRDYRPFRLRKKHLLKIIASLLSPTSGRFFDGKDIATLSPELIASRSLTRQTPALFGDGL
jgi:ABC-type iron transport system FetAB ATPase subunit